MRKSRDNLTFIEKKKSGNGGERGRCTIGGNGVGIMRDEMRRGDNKESSSETNHSWLSQLKAAFSAASSFLKLTQLLCLLIHLFCGRVIRKSHLSKEKRLC